ncbi:protein of unknown function [Sanguibacter gelidistatuariae]|uniref:Protein-glutamine gamma-glutamyltransferase-like C-terminal domain-containing protein n=1 Tax=Sanguibacter gelidistatuariae TaxID=1814289 RepID=A0A1G6JDL5_9MICO|nr:DUF4129 domain-containing protein [Sanguibacter gelidistatuariae]SDC16769.1 protein of unknown function [Sanguibacter gelidistatuariae]
MSHQPRTPDELIRAARGPRRTALAVAAATILLLVVVAGAALSGDWSLDPGPAPTMTLETVPPTTEPTAAPPMFDPGDGATNEWGSRVVSIVLTVAAALLAAFLLYRAALWVRRTLLPWLATRRDRPTDAAPQPTIDLEVVPLSALREAATHAETLLREGEHSTDAIIAAWLALEDAAVRSGATRGAAQTPTEFTVAVLGTTPASPQAVTELLGLYHLARFAHTDMTAAQVAAAGAALRRLTEDFSNAPADEGAPA